MKRPPVVVTIGEVRLHGFDPHGRAAIGDALGRESTHLFQRGYVTKQSHAAERVDAGAFTARRDAAPSALGKGIAARVHRSVSKPC